MRINKMDGLKKNLMKLVETGAFHITFGTFFTKFVAFFGSIFVVRLLTKEQFGLLSYVENIYSYAVLFLSLGLTNGVLRYVVLAGTPEKKIGYHDYTLIRGIFINIIIVVIMEGINLFVNYPPAFEGARIWLAIIVISLPFRGCIDNELLSFRALFLNKRYAYCSVISTIVLIVGRVVGAYVDGTGGVIWSRVLLEMVFAFVFIIVAKKSYFGLYKKEKISVEEKRTVNTYSLQYMITNGLWALFMLNDTFLLGYLNDSSTLLADYRVAIVLPANISIFAIAIGTYAGPYFTKNEKRVKWIRQSFKKMYIISMSAVFMASLVLILFTEPIIEFMYGSQYKDVASLMRLLTVGAFINSGLRYPIGNTLAAIGKIKYNMTISAVGIGIQVLLDIILIPKFDAVGIAFSNIIVYSIMTIYLLIAFIKETKV